MPTCKFTKKTLSQILRSFSKNASRLLLPKRLLKCANKISFRKYEQKVVPTGTTRGIDFDLTLILPPYVEDQISTNFRVISTYFFDVISPIEKSMSFPRTFFDVISLFEKSTLFPRIFFGVILLIEKSTLFPRTFFDVISMVEKSTLFPCTFFWCNFAVRKIRVVSTYYFRCNFYGGKIYVVSTLLVSM